MKRFIQHNILKMCIIFLLVQPLIDISTSLLVRFSNITLTLGVITRFLFLLFITAYALFISKSKFRKSTIIYISLVIVYTGVYIIYTLYSKDSMYFITECKVLLKSFYFVFLLCSFVLIFDEKKSSIDIKYAAYTGVIYVISILIAAITKTDFLSYKHGKLGSSGWFFSANEVGTIVGILFPALICYSLAWLEKFKAYKLALSSLTVFLYIGILLYMGTKVPLLCALLTLGVVFIIQIVRVFFFGMIKQQIIKAAVIAIILAITILTLPLSPAGHNLKEHMIAAGFQNIVDFLDVFEDQFEMNSPTTTTQIESSTPVVKKQTNGSSLEASTNLNLSTDNPLTNDQESIQDIGESKEGTNISDKDYKNVIYSGRDRYLLRVKQEIKNRPFINKIIGIGSMHITEGQDIQVINVERDFHDIYFHFGLAGFLIYFTPVVILLLLILSGVVRNPKKTLNDYSIIASSLGLLLSFAVSYMAGHVLSAPAVSIYSALFMATLFNKTANLNVEIL